MITSIKVQNFRILEDIEVGPFSQLNLITGKNNVGKTTLLEALWLYHGRWNPATIWNPNIRRRLPPIDPAPLLYIASMTSSGNRIMITGKEGADASNEVIFEVEEGGVVSLPLSQKEATGLGQQPGDVESQQATQAVGVDQVITILEEAGKKQVRLAAKRRFTTEGVQIEMPKLELQVNRPSGIILLANRDIGSETLARLSKVIREGNKDELLSFLEVIEPRLSNVEILSELQSGPAKGQPSIWCQLRDGSGLPAPVMGDGFNRVLHLLVSMYEARNGLIAVDEIENGIHYLALPKLWEKIASLALQLNVQVFATTHSRECVHAAYTSLREPVSFSLHRLHLKDRSIRSTSYQGDEIGAALDMDFEVR